MKYENDENKSEQQIFQYFLITFFDIFANILSYC